MKVRTISRSSDVYERGTKYEANKVFHNFDPVVHPFEKAREYSRALNAVKLDKMFAKPFLNALGGHMDSVFSLAKHSTSLSCIISGACDGEIRVWNLSTGCCVQSIKHAHRGFVRGLCVAPAGKSFFSCGADGRVNLWEMDFDVLGINDVDGKPWENLQAKALNTYTGNESFNAIDHQYGSECFATVSSSVQIWDVNRSQPVQTIAWGSAETHHTVRWNAAEPNILSSAASDRTITMYDSRAKSALRKITLPGRTNAMCWNPREPYVFTAANEDHNLYTFDMRFVKKPLQIHRDFVSAVMCVDYNPTGREFVAGSYDQTVRIFPVAEQSSREVYHTKRMHHVFSVLYSQDSKYVISGSDDSIVRLWKGEASKALGLLHPGQKEKFDYRERLKKRYGDLEEVRRIMRHQHNPKPVHTAKKRKRAMLAAAVRKDRRKRLHGSLPPEAVAAKDKVVLEEQV